MGDLSWGNKGYRGDKGNIGQCIWQLSFELPLAFFYLEYQPIFLSKTLDATLLGSTTSQTQSGSWNWARALHWVGGVDSINSQSNLSATCRMYSPSWQPSAMPAMGQMNQNGKQA